MSSSTETGTGNTESTGSTESTVQYQSFLDLGPKENESGESEVNLISLGGFTLSEGYNAGWRGSALMSATSSTPLSIGNMMGAALLNGVIPGASAILRLALRSSDASLDGTVIRSWPVMIGDVEPFSLPESNTVACSVEIVDPITYLADRPIWGAYRSCSIGEMIGGALSLAAGGDGKPTLKPVLPEMPAVEVTQVTREALDELPYSIAVGQTLGDWLGQILGLLGLRIVLSNYMDGIMLSILDGKPTSATNLEMTVTDDRSETANDGPIYINGLSARPGGSIRGAMLDDPTQSGFRRIGSGAVGRLFSGADIGIDEAAQRSISPMFGTYAEMFVASTLSTHPRVQAGGIIELNRTLRGIKEWQVARVDHRQTFKSYLNGATLLTAEISWCPQAPNRRPPIIVPGFVDGGADFGFNEPVPRDRLGRVPIRFPFIPTPVGEEAQMLATYDDNYDGRITMDDFKDEEGEAGEWFGGFDTKERADNNLALFREGKLDDPYPEREDDDLDADELQLRETLAKQREYTLNYMTYLETKEQDSKDRDRDGYVSERDELVSDDLNTALQDPDKEEDLKTWLVSYKAGTLEDDHPDLSDDDKTLVQEYDRLFGAIEGTDNDALTKQFGDDPNKYLDAREDAQVKSELWPPRLPLTIIQPMAGGLHGFIPGHRSGDACRVAVHDPLWAEVIGFQYRDDRALNEGIKGATAGIVVEHDTGSAWSGVVFRRTDQVEEDALESYHYEDIEYLAPPDTSNTGSNDPSQPTSNEEEEEEPLEEYVAGEGVDIGNDGSGDSDPGPDPGPNEDWDEDQWGGDNEGNNQGTTGNQNTGNQNQGNQNTGNQNTGNQNQGNQNQGNQNTGNQNTGNQNQGNQNQGNQNTGNQNQGNQNQGNQNQGNQDTGNQGNQDTGNQGNQDTGNQGNQNTGNQGNQGPGNQ